MQLAWIYRAMVIDTKYDHEITQFTRNWPLHPPKGRLFYTIYFRLHHGGTFAELLVYNLIPTERFPISLIISHTSIVASICTNVNIYSVLNN